MSQTAPTLLQILSQFLNWNQIIPCQKPFKGYVLPV